jgi:hypothetical protein
LEDASFVGEEEAEEAEEAEEEEAEEEAEESSPKKPSKKITPKKVSVDDIIEKLREAGDEDDVNAILLSKDITNAVMIEIVETMGGKVSNKKKATKPLLVSMIIDLLNGDEVEESSPKKKPTPKKSSPKKKPSPKLTPKKVSIDDIIEKLNEAEDEDDVNQILASKDITNAIMIEIVETMGGKVSNKKKATKPMLVDMIIDLLNKEEKEEDDEEEEKEEEDEEEEQDEEAEEDDDFDINDYEKVTDLNKLKKIYSSVIDQLNERGRVTEKKGYNNIAQIRTAIRNALGILAKLPKKSPVKSKTPTPKPVSPTKKPVGVIGVGGKPVVGKPSVLEALGVGREVGGKNLERTLLDMNLLNDRIMNEINSCLTGKK